MSKRAEANFYLFYFPFFLRSKKIILNLCQTSLTPYFNFFLNFPLSHTLTMDLILVVFGLQQYQNVSYFKELEISVLMGCAFANVIFVQKVMTLLWGGGSSDHVTSSICIAYAYLLRLIYINSIMQWYIQNDITLLEGSYGRN